MIDTDRAAALAAAVALTAAGYHEVSGVDDLLSADVDLAELQQAQMILDSILLNCAHARMPARTLLEVAGMIAAYIATTDDPNEERQAYERRVRHSQHLLTSNGFPVTIRTGQHWPATDPIVHRDTRAYSPLTRGMACRARIGIPTRTTWPPKVKRQVMSADDRYRRLVERDRMLMSVESERSG